MQKLTKSQKTAIGWMRNIDRNRYVFNFLKSIPLLARILFYAGLTVFNLSIFILMSTFINIDGSPFEDIFKFIIYSLAAVVMVISAASSFYESIINSTNPEKIIAEQDAVQANIKAEKLEYWRLRNMNLFWRSVVFVGIYAVILLISQIAVANSFTEIYPNPTDLQKAAVQAAHADFLKYLTFAYFIAVLAIDYKTEKIIQKRRAKNEKAN